jgi:hypothetical protein
MGITCWVGCCIIEAALALGGNCWPTKFIMV